MTRVRTAAAVEADLAALRLAAERAGTALACLFSSSDEFEAAVVDARRARGGFPYQQRARLRSRAFIGLLALAFLLL